MPNGTNDNVTIEYKEFGIRLTLTPTVMNNRRIALKVAPEVSELDYSAGIQSGGVAVPALRVRRTDTSVMLADGEFRDQRADQQQLGEQRRQVSLAGRHPDPRCVLPLDQAGQGRPRAC